MRIFATLYRFELKKILQKKYILALLTLMIAATAFLNLRPLFGYQDVAYLDENNEFVFENVSYYQAIQLDRRFAEEYSGQLLDNDIACYMRDTDAQYQEIYSTFAAPEMSCILRNHYLVFESLYNLGINPQLESIDCIADFAYQAMQEWQEREYKSQKLTETEIDYWNEERSKITTPFAMAYSEGYSEILDKAYWLNMMMIVFVLISLCSSFSDDDAYQTGPLLTSTRFGRRQLILARLAAGESLACGSVLLLFGLTASIQLFTYGTDGFQAPIQLLHHLSGSSRAITAGQAVLLVIGMSLLLAIFSGAVSMFLSKLFRKAIPALALPLGLLLLSLVFDVSLHFYSRLRSQIWSYFPFQRLSETFLLDERLVSVGGAQLDCVRMGILLYGGLTLIALAACIMVCKIRLVDRK